MQRRNLDLSPEERKFVNRWQLAILGSYVAIALAAFIVLRLTSAGTGGTLESRVNAANPTVTAKVK